MAITGSSPEIRSDKNLAHERISETDNVKDIKENLSKLKAEVFNKIKTWDQNHEYLWSKFKDNEVLFNATVDDELNSIDLAADNLFDTFAHTKENQLQEILHTSDDIQAKQLLKILEKQFEEYLFNSSSIKNKLIWLKELFGDVVRFELIDLRGQIKVPSSEKPWKDNSSKNALLSNKGEWDDEDEESENWDNSSQNALLSDKDEWTHEGKWDKKGKEVKRYKSKNDYLEAYQQRWYANAWKKMDIANIYRDNKLSTYMEKIFDNEEGKELRRWTFTVNLGTENGLAGIVIKIREAIANKDSDEDNEYKKLYDILVEKRILDDDGETINLNFSRKNLKELIKSQDLVYERASWIDNELTKVAKILSRAKWTDLDIFASLLQSKADIPMAVKERNNALDMTGQNREKTEKWKSQTSLIDADNVLEFLCDFNSDGQISAEYKRKNNKEQKNQWDVWPLFGQQVMWQIEQAIAVKNVELGDPKWEQVIISNIIKNITIADSRNLTNIHLVTMQKDPTACTRENLANLINGNDDDIYPMPEMKIFFLDAIKKINGWSNEVQPDLYDTLVGKDTESLLSLYATESNLKNKLDEILLTSQDPETQEIIRREGLVRVRETIFTKIMTAIDHVQITTNNGAKTQLQAAWVEKWWETRALKKELLENTIKWLILSWIHYSTTGGWRCMLGYGKQWISESWRTKRARGAQGWLIIGPEKTELALQLSWEVAEQYNHKNVINANLSKVKSAKYVGIEWWVLAGVSPSDRWAQAEASAGLNRQKDPLVGINQIDKQYRAVSEEIFDITWASPSVVSDKEKFRTYISNKIQQWKNDNVYGKFIENNTQHLQDNLDFMVRYMDANKFFWADSILKKYPKISTTSALNALLDIIQSGNIESRRSDIIAWLHGKIALTKLSFGVTTNALTLRTTWSWSNAPTAGSSSGETTGAWSITWGGGENEWWTGSQENLGENRFGIAGFYIGLRISTWKNSYVPNEAQYTFTQYETGQGIGTEYIENPAKDLNIYGKYLIALYNDKKERLSYEVDDGRLLLRFDPQWSDLTLAKFLNIHATTAAKTWFSLRDNVLTIWDIGDMAAYTITEAKGVRRILCLGSKKIDDAHRVTWDRWPEIVDKMQIHEKNIIPRSKEKITTKLITKMTGTGTTTPETTLNIQKDAARFFDAEGKFTKPADVTLIDAGNILWTKFTTWTLTITKNSDKNFTISLISTPIDQSTIEYIDQERYEHALVDAEKIPENWKTREIISSTEIKNIFKLPTYFGTTFTDQTEKPLSMFDDYNKTLYRTFMESIVDPNADAFINTDDYTEAFNILKSILTKQTSAYGRLPESFRNFIEKPDLSSLDKIYIVDKFKTIFSYITCLTDGKHDGSDLVENVGWRWLVYTKMKWPNGEKYPLSTDYRAMILKNLKWKDTLTREPVANLIGFTAFYKLKNEKWRKYAMTPVGWTNVLSWGDLTQSMIAISDEQEKANAQGWFINNLTINTENKTMMVDKISQLLKDKNIDIKADYLEKNLTNILTWKELAIDSFRKITINSSRMFYLLGECGNESLGMQLNGITIHEFTNVPVQGKYTATWTPEKTYEGGMDLNIKSHSIASKVLSKEKNVGGTYHQALDNILPLAGSKAWDTDQKWDINAWWGGNE